MATNYAVIQVLKQLNKNGTFTLGNTTFASNIACTTGGSVTDGSLKINDNVSSFTLEANFPSAKGSAFLAMKANTPKSTSAPTNADDWVIIGDAVNVTGSSTKATFTVAVNGSNNIAVNMGICAFIVNPATLTQGNTQHSFT